MKWLLLSVGIAAFICRPVHAQETKPTAGNSSFVAGNKSDGDVQRQQQTQRAALRTPQQLPTGAMMARPVVYSGFLVDLVKTDRPFKMLDLRSPLTSTNAAELYTDPETNKPRGFVLFSVKF